jgi:hypothetical protein
MRDIPDVILRHVNRANPVETGFSGAGMSREMRVQKAGW